MVKSRQAIEDNLNAFCQDSDAYLEGAENGPLAKEERTWDGYLESR